MRPSPSPIRRALAGSLLLLASAGCGGSSKGGATRDVTAADQPLFLLGALDLDATNCVANSDPSAPFLSSGTLDLAFATSYSARLLVENPYSQGAASPQQTERVSLTGAEITLTTADGTALGDYSTVATGFIDAAPAGSSGYGSAAFTVIPSALGASDAVKNATQLIAKIRVVGEALNGIALTSNTFDFPITVCDGCLVRYPADAADTTLAAGSYYLCAFAVFGQPPPNPCVFGQDKTFSCVLCAEAYPVCRDPKQNPAYNPELPR